MEGAGLFVLFAIIAIAVAAGSWYLKQKRLDEWQQATSALGLRYAHDDPFDTVGLDFKLFSLGDGRGVENVGWGSHRGQDVRVFDYWYYTTSTDSEGHTSRNYSRFTCSLAEIPAWCPHTTVARENLFTRFADLAGFRDQEFESEEFNRRFQVTSQDQRFASYLIDARMMEWLLTTDGDVNFEVHGGLILGSVGRTSPANIAWLIDRVCDFVEQVPRVVAETYPKERA